MKRGLDFLLRSGLLGVVMTGLNAVAAEFKVIAFYTGKDDAAHVSFVREANAWFPEMARRYHFDYEATTDWTKLNAQFLAEYQVVVFLDSRPEDPAQRNAFQVYMERGGGWMGFHFAAFALTPSRYPENWDWYHEEFLGSGAYVSNTWRPTSAVLRVAEGNHPSTKNLPVTFKSSPNEWYRWQRDLRKNPHIKVLLSIDESSFPLGTGPKSHEIWHEGYYPVVWTNLNYRMIYVNMGHNNLDYTRQPPTELSRTFTNETQNQLIIQSLQWLGRRDRR